MTKFLSSNAQDFIEDVLGYVQEVAEHLIPEQ